jgi:hypothetical protein
LTPGSHPAVILVASEARAIQFSGTKEGLARAVLDAVERARG